MDHRRMIRVFNPPYVGFLAAAYTDFTQIKAKI
jgi:hypothetical protein